MVFTDMFAKSGNAFRYVLIFSILLAGCATTHTVRHAFSFDLIDENPQVEVIDWQYGESKNFGAHPLPEQSSTKRVNVIGELIYPKSLYVKWRNIATNSIHEDTVNLEIRLPKNIVNQRIHFSIKDDQLYVFLITHELRPIDWPVYPPGYSKIYKSYQIYPDKS